MASSQALPKPELITERGTRQESSLLRLLSAERSEEIFPIILEELVRLGFPRALVLEVDFEAGEVKPAASLNCNKAELDQFRTSLWARDNPVISALRRPGPSEIRVQSGRGETFYAQPMFYRSRSRCWEAESQHRQDCLAVQNYRAARNFPFEEQICSSCGMKG